VYASDAIKSVGDSRNGRKRNAQLSRAATLSNDVNFRPAALVCIVKMVIELALQCDDARTGHARSLPAIDRIDEQFFTHCRAITDNHCSEWKNQNRME
jgi:hypothetical protein